MSDQVVGPFFQLVAAGETQKVALVLAAAPALVNAVGPHPFWGGRPQALHLAIEGKRRDMFDLLLDRGADINGTNTEYDHWSPLMLAVNRAQHDMRDELLRRGATIGIVDALILGDDQSLDRLLAEGPLPAITPNGGSILAFARTPTAIDRLLALGAPVDVADRWGTTPIEALSRLGPHGHALVAHLARRGVAVAPQEYARMGDLAALRQLVDADASVASLDAVMMGAVDFGHVALVEWLLTRGGNVQARSVAGSRHTALHSAAWNGDLPMVTCLVHAGADLQARDMEHQATPVDWAETAVKVTNNPKCADVAAYLKTL
jgi:hypothetical protein